jgi:hypothetical protein
MKTRNDASKTTSEVDGKNRIEEQFISSHAFHQTAGERVREITAREQFKPRILDSFDPTTQEVYRELPSTQKFIHKQLGQEKRVLIHSYHTNQRGQEQGFSSRSHVARTKPNLAGQ